jgi:lipopolysaccharide transport system permease protein
MSDKVEYVIEPNRSWFRIPWKEIVEYKDLLYLLVRRDFVSKYKQTILGPVWLFLQPLLMTIVFTVVFKKMAGFKTGDVPGILFYYSGMLAWQYFSRCFNSTATTFMSHAHLFGKVYFPRLIVPLAVVISNLLAYFIMLGTFLAFLVAYKFVPWSADTYHVSLSVAFLPLLILQTAALGLGVGLWMSALTAKYRDFAHLAGFLIQLWMFATLPIFMMVEAVPAKYQWVLAVNPVCSIVRWYRMAFLGLGTVEAGHMIASVAVTVLLLLSGVLMFSKVERTFIDTV